MEENIELNLSEIIDILLKGIKVIAIMTVAFAFLAFGYSRWIVTPLYTANVQLYVDPMKDAPGSSTDLTNINYAQKVVTTYINILSTQSFYKEVAKDARVEYTTNQLREMIKISAVQNTEIFKVSVTTPDPKVSLKIAESFTELAPEKIIEIKDTDSLKVVDPAVLPERPSNNRTTLNTLVGAILGMLLGIGIIFVREMMDNRVKGEEDLARHYDLPILGTVPDFDKINVKRGKNSYESATQKQKNG